MKRRVGLFGGSFNPIHSGHLHLAQAVRDALCLDSVLLMPTGEAPHKSSAAYAPAADRLEMCRLASEHFPWMAVSDDEIRKNGKSYTVETLRALTVQHPDIEWTLMIGSDMLLTFDTWKDWQEILRMAEICAVSRENGDLPALREKADALCKECPAAVIRVLNVPAFPVSSTEIRQNIKNIGADYCLLPENVVQYIREKGLYPEHPEQAEAT